MCVICFEGLYFLVDPLQKMFGENEIILEYYSGLEFIPHIK